MSLARRDLLFGRFLGRSTDPALHGDGPRLPRLEQGRCLARTSFCAACVERCPRPGALTLLEGWPTLDAGACDGCGTCVTVCPAPSPALRLERREILP